jgi:predicted DNA-binding ribbon-helix-helix protein
VREQARRSALAGLDQGQEPGRASGEQGDRAMNPKRRRGRHKASPQVKRSVVVAGHKTSVSLEGAFWNALKEIAAARSIRVSKLISTIKIKRQRGTNLSSATRLFVLDYYQRLVRRAPNSKHPRARR